VNLITDDRQHERRHGQIAGRAEIGLAGAAARPVHADAHQHHADHGDDRAGHHRREEAQHVFDERRDAEAEYAADQDGVKPTPGIAAMASIGEIDTAVTPMMIGSLMPNGPKPTVWIRVAMPQANKSALISIAI
jgi:hypothetical protein